MRVYVSDDSVSGKAIRGLLLKAGVVVDSWHPIYKVLVSNIPTELVIVDGIDCELERRVVAEITRVGVSVLVNPGPRNEFRIRIDVPEHPDLAAKVEKAIFNALLKVVHGKKSLWQRLTMPLVLALLPTLAYPQTTVRFWDGANLVNAADSANNALRVNLVAGGAASDGSILDGDNSLIKGTVFDKTNSNPLAVAIVDANGDQITSFGGGTQYTEGDTDATITGTALLWEDAGNTLRPVAAGTPLPIGDAGGSLTVDGTIAATQSGGWTVTANAGSGTFVVGDGGGSITVDGPTSTVGATATFNSVNDVATVSLDGAAGATCVILAGTLSATLVVEASHDGGSTYPSGLFFTTSTTGGKVMSLAVTNPNLESRMHPAMGGGTTNVRLRVSAYTSGSADAYCTANTAMDAFSLALNVGVHGSASALYTSMNGAYAEADGAALDSSGVAEGDVSRFKTDIEGRHLVRTDHPRRVLCRLTTTATTSTLITGCSAPGASVSIWITDVSIMGGAATGATAAASIQYGTGGACGTGTTVVYDCQHPATSGCHHTFNTPLKVAANNEVCLLDAATGTKWVTVSGYIAP